MSCCPAVFPSIGAGLGAEDRDGGEAQRRGPRSFKARANSELMDRKLGSSLGL